MEVTISFNNRPGEVRRRDVVARLAGEKITKELANYRTTHDAKTKQVCFECHHYEQPGGETSACRRVTGIVEARDTCDLWVNRMD